MLKQIKKMLDYLFGFSEKKICFETLSLTKKKNWLNILFYYELWFLSLPGSLWYFISKIIVSQKSDKYF